jgi:hypothetical protein
VTVGEVHSDIVIAFGTLEKVEIVLFSEVFSTEMSVLGHGQKLSVHYSRFLGG